MKWRELYGTGHKPSYTHSILCIPGLPPIPANRQFQSTSSRCAAHWDLSDLKHSLSLCHSHCNDFLPTRDNYIVEGDDHGDLWNRKERRDRRRRLQLHDMGNYYEWWRLGYYSTRRKNKELILSKKNSYYSSPDRGRVTLRSRGFDYCE